MKYFTIEELSKTNTGLSNTPSLYEKENLIHLVNEVLDPIRDKLGLPIIINSGYRSPLVNRKVGGVPNSQHIKGQAADIKCKDMKKLWEVCVSFINELPIDQLINEKNLSWIHISFSNNPRHQIL